MPARTFHSNPTHALKPEVRAERHILRPGLQRQPPRARLYTVDSRALREIALDQKGPYRRAVKAGERLVFWVDPWDLSVSDLADLVRAFKAIVKRLRAEGRDGQSWPVPPPKAVEAWLLHRDGWSIADIARRLWPKTHHQHGWRQARRAVNDMDGFLETPAGATFKDQGFLDQSHPED